MKIKGINMSAKPAALAALLALGIGSSANAADMAPVYKAAPAPIAPFFLVNDNSVSYSYAFTANNPGDVGNTPKHVLNFTHFDVWAYGTNFFTVDWLKATNGANTPAAPCDDPTSFRFGATDCAGYTEIYGLFRSTFGLNQLTGSKMFSNGILTNVELAIGADLNTDNTTLGSSKKSIQAGLQFDFAMPYKGFFNVGLFAYKEWQNDGFAARGVGGAPFNFSGDVDFDTTWAIEILYVQPLGFIPQLPLTYKALVVIHGDKGCGEPCNPGPGLVRTTEYLTQQTLALDVGQMAWNKPGKLSMWVAYRYWKNKFGIDDVQPFGAFPSTTESTWITGLTVAF
jgi:nucleoside-specific outer membrane channel protein Tsx